MALAALNNLARAQCYKTFPSVIWIKILTFKSLRATAVLANVGSPEKEYCSCHHRDIQYRSMSVYVGNISIGVKENMRYSWIKKGKDRESKNKGNYNSR